MTVPRWARPWMTWKVAAGSALGYLAAWLFAPAELPALEPKPIGQTGSDPAPFGGGSSSGGGASASW